MNSFNPQIVVVGGGIAGCVAAIAAAEERKSVLLVDRSVRIGGNATNSNVGTICGAYYRNSSGIPRLTGYKFCELFISKLIALSGSKPINYHNGLFVIPYEWSVLQSLLEQQLKNADVTIWNEAEVTNLQTNQNRIAQLDVKKDGKRFQLNTDAVIDCSGNGIASQLARLNMLSSSSYQSASQIFRVNKILSDNEFSLNMALKKTMVQLVNVNNWPVSFETLSVIPGSLKNNQADFKITMPGAVTDDPNLNGVLDTEAKAWVVKIFPYLTKNITSLKNAEIATIFPELGIRVLQRSKGKSVLTEASILSCEKHDHGITIGTWPLEEWNADGTVKMEYPENDSGYMIPADCLISYQLENLFFAGKNISATTKAIASARVMGTCLQTGYAAGKIASCISDEEREKMILNLNEELRLRNG